MASIGSYNFITLTGQPLEPMAVGVEVINREGVDGVDIRKTAKRPRAAQKETFVDCLDISAANTLEKNYLALKGTVVSVTEGTGRVCTNILVQDVNVIEIKPLLSAVGGTVGSTFSVKARWTLLPVNPEGLS